MKIAIIDTCYPDFVASLPAVTSYDAGLNYALSCHFGTFDAYSRGLRNLGHEAIDVLANYEALQNQWTLEATGMRAWDLKKTALEQIEAFAPDCVFIQDLGYFDLETTRELSKKYILAGQCSCRFDDDERLKCFDVLFSSFPFHVDRFNRLGVHGVFLPLAFDPIVIERVEIPVNRTHVAIVGGYGRHWEMDRLFKTLAEQTPIQFWGYGYEKAPEIVRKKWHGEAWGLEMYRIYMRSLIVVNRHGGISQGLSNNLRLFEATGCGALLMTEDSPNIRDYFRDDECVAYTSPDDCASKINYYLTHPDELLEIASRGQRRTLREHTYAQRLPVVSRTLTELKDKAA